MYDMYTLAIVMRHGISCRLLFILANHSSQYLKIKIK